MNPKPYLYNLFTSTLIFYWPWWFALGVIIPLFLPVLLPWWVWAVGLFVAGLALISSCRPARWVVIPLLLGLMLASWVGHRLLDQKLPTALIKKDVVISGYISGLPVKKERVVRFNFVIETMDSSEQSESNKKAQTKKELSLMLPSKTRLSWYGSKVPLLADGQRWQFTVRLKPAHGSHNPGAFDYETWLFARGIRTTGYVRSKAETTQLPSRTQWLNANQFRSRVVEFIDSSIVGPQRGILSALGVGVRTGLSDADWQLLQDTGTIHLVAISGLHLGLVAGFFFFIGSFIWRHIGLARFHIPTHKIGAISSVMAGAVYASLAGFSIPTLRALWMLITAALILMVDRNPPLRFSFGLVLAVVLLLDPLAPLSAGFWLSFGAVAVILYASKKEERLSDVTNRDGQLIRRVAQSIFSKLKVYAHIQVAIFLGLAPILLFLFQKLSLVSLVANTLAIPVIGFLVVPLVLLAMALFALGWETGAQLVFTVAQNVLAWLWQWLEMMANWSMALWQQAMPPLWTVVMAVLGVIILLLPKVFPGRLIGLAWIAPLLLVKPAQPAVGEAWVTILDVGQGLASVVQTQNHTLIYDVGPAFSSGYDAGEDVVLPFLQHQGVKHIDALVISHANADHDGGLDAVLEGVPVNTLWTGEADLRKVAQVNQNTCLAGISWQWDGVNFSFLHPDEDSGFTDNNASCVLRIEVGGQRLLLTGDIEQAAEASLLSRYDEERQSLSQEQDQDLSLRANILLAPHHGSKTSSTQRFVDQVDPDMVIISAGYWNRFKHPHPSVTKRYHEQGARIISTADSGAITVKLGTQTTNSKPNFSDDAKYDLGQYRIERHRYWIE